MVWLKSLINVDLSDAKIQMISALKRKKISSHLEYIISMICTQSFPATASKVALKLS